MAFGSGPSLILVNREEIDANSHVGRARVSVQTQICVSLVINVFNRKKRLVFISSPRIIWEMGKDSAKIS